MVQGGVYGSMDSRRNPISRKLRTVWQLQWHLHLQPKSVKALAEELKVLVGQVSNWRRVEAEVLTIPENSSAGVQRVLSLVKFHP